MLQNFKNVSEHFTTFRSKGLIFSTTMLRIIYNEVDSVSDTKKKKYSKYKLRRIVFKISLKSFFKLTVNGLTVRFWDNLPNIGC